jgi:hypothetical protein
VQSCSHFLTTDFTENTGKNTEENLKMGKFENAISELKTFRGFFRETRVIRGKNFFLCVLCGLCG